MRRDRRFRARACLFIALAPWGLACGPERPPAPDTARLSEPLPTTGPSAAEAASTWDPATPAVLTYAGDRGQFLDASTLDDVPDDARPFVRVNPLEGPKPPAGFVFVGNLTEVGMDDAGHYALKPVARADFEELCLEGRSSTVELPDGLEAPDVVPKSEAVIVYKTEWCGVCKKLLAYLDRKGVPYEVHDIEKDKAAAAEMATKVKAVGHKPGSVPVIDVHGEVLIGFDRSRLEKLL